MNTGLTGGAEVEAGKSITAIDSPHGISVLGLAPSQSQALARLGVRTLRCLFDKHVRSLSRLPMFGKEGLDAAYRWASANNYPVNRDYLHSLVDFGVFTRDEIGALFPIPMTPTTTIRSLRPILGSLSLDLARHEVVTIFDLSAYSESSLSADLGLTRAEIEQVANLLHQAGLVLNHRKSPPKPTSQPVARPRLRKRPSEAGPLYAFLYGERGPEIPPAVASEGYTSFARQVVFR